jgi:hypothetical protein
MNLDIKTLLYIIIFLLIVVVILQIVTLTKSHRENYNNCVDYKSEHGCNKSALNCLWVDNKCQDANSSKTHHSSTPSSSSSSTTNGDTGLLNCPVPTGSVEPRDMNGNPVDWWVIIKYPHELDNKSKTNCKCYECEGTPKPGSGNGACYFYADSNNQELTWYGEGNCINTCNNAMSRTIAQANSNNKFGTWNDQPEIGNNCGAPHAHSKGMVCYDQNGGFVLNTTTPHFPIDSTSTGNSPAGCQDDDNLKAAQQFFCMSFSMSELKKWGQAIENARLCGRQPWNVSEILSQNGISHGKSIVNVPLKTRGGIPIVLTVKAGSDNYNPWSLVSAGLGQPLQVASWTSTKDGPKGSAWGTSPCYPGSKGMLQVVTMGSNDHGIFKATYGTTHAKFAIGVRGDWVTFGSMNEQNSQAERGGDFYSMQNSNLWNTINQWIKNGSTRVPANCGYSS